MHEHGDVPHHEDGEETARERGGAAHDASPSPGGDPPAPGPTPSPLSQQIGQQDDKAGVAWAFSFADATKTMAMRVTCPSNVQTTFPLDTTEVKAVIAWLSSLVGQMKGDKGGK